MFFHALIGIYPEPGRSCEFLCESDMVVSGEDLDLMAIPVHLA
jgi:hypothetical protein